MSPIVCNIDSTIDRTILPMTNDVHDRRTDGAYDSTLDRANDRATIVRSRLHTMQHDRTIVETVPGRRSYDCAYDCTTDFAYIR
jgi:hypothetical protein